MKKLALALIGLTLVGSSAFAQTTGVLSRNAVGYVKVSVGKGKLELIRNDFEDITGAGIAITNIIGNQVPTDSSVLLWNYSLQTYIAANKLRSGWDAQGTNRLLRGQSFFLRVPSTAVSNEYQVYLMGEVPDKTTAPSTTVSVINGIGMYGVGYPVTEKWTNTTIAKAAKTDDSVLIWDYSNQTYVAGNKLRSGWDATGVALTLRPGQGFWFRTSLGATNWVITKPYTWP